jgi:hypothetical protein
MRASSSNTSKRWWVSGSGWGGAGGSSADQGLRDGLGELVVGERERDVTLWWVGVHGGAGESTLERIFRGTRAAGHRWPVAPPGSPPVVVVLVARTDARGLRAAQSAMRDWQTRGLNLRLLGLVLMADAPTRLPRALRDLQRVVSGGVPRVWSLPWVESWRVGEVPSRANSPTESERLLADLRSAAPLGGEAGM